MKRKFGSLLLGICLVAAVFSVVPAEAHAAVGWTKVSGYWYYYNASGVKLTGWQTLPSRNGTDLFYLDPATSPSGQMVMGWQKIPRGVGKWYYFDPVDEQGGVLKGWQKLRWSGGTSWFFLDPATSPSGQMVVGWQKIPRGTGDWYYLNPGPNNDAGNMLTG
ncbi:MAG: hypothetical protein LBM94_06725 [Propionibacteriaceae bacterium]|jgi:hypothetical protein|nr:hypothetical protein [Propionibacteriaceae bacterium]